MLIFKAVCILGILASVPFIKKDLKPESKHIFRDIAWLVGLFLLVKFDGNCLLLQAIAGIKRLPKRLAITSPNLYSFASWFRSLGFASQLIACVVTLVMYSIVILIAYEIYRKHAPAQEVKKLTDIHSLKPTRYELKMYGYTILFLYLSNIILGALNNIIFKQSTTENEHVANKLFAMGGPMLVMMTLATVVFAPIAEELMFRGSLLNLFFKHNHKFFSPPVIICGFAFSCFHMSTNIDSFLIYMVAGMILANCYEKTGTLRTSIASHMTCNFIAVIGIFTMLLH